MRNFPSLDIKCIVELPSLKYCGTGTGTHRKTNGYNSETDSRIYELVGDDGVWTVGYQKNYIRFLSHSKIKMNSRWVKNVTKSFKNLKKKNCNPLVVGSNTHTDTHTQCALPA